jgi:hypothetical protein
VALALIPATVHAQTGNMSYEVPPSLNSYLPIGHYRMEEGGFFIYFDILYWQARNTMKDQTVAVRGGMDFDGSITGTVGNRFGSGEEALNTYQVAGPYLWTPGLNFGMGWRFESGWVMNFSWIHLTDLRYSAHATLVPHNFNFGFQLENTFLFSPVVNFPADFAGEPQNVAVGNPGATFGIWNAAYLMQIQFLQRYEQFDLTFRVPVSDAQDYRSYGLFGPRIAWIWERFKWRTVSADLQGLSVADDIANYSNVVSNRLYGLHVGGGQEWFWGDTPVGAFSGSLDGEVGLFFDFVKGRARYELEDRSAGSNRARNLITLAPLVRAKADIWWYPIEAIQINMGYDLELYFNTVASRRPIDFDYSGLNPHYDKGVYRLYHGFHFGFGVTF